MINVSKLICKCVELLLIFMSALCDFFFFFYGGQYSEQTAARAEISAEAPRGINAARTRYHMLLQWSHGEDEEDEEES